MRTRALWFPPMFYITISNGLLDGTHAHGHGALRGKIVRRSR